MKGKAMRSAEEMLELVVSVARGDPRIRAVLLNGSRANPNAKPDILQDFDVVYLVNEVEPFIRDRAWISVFGDLLILQTPEDMEEPPPSRDGRYAYLMLFTDGNRLDLGLQPVSLFEAEPLDSLTVVLLDKDLRLRAIPPSGEAGYVLPAPTAKAFADCCNEFLWVSTNFAKGLWRDEIVYAKVMFEQYVRPQALRMLDWYIAMQTGFSINPGKLGKRYRQLLPADLWTLVELSYSDAQITNAWAALNALNEAFRIASTAIAGQLGFEYPAREVENVRHYLARLEALPRGAKAVF
jgi:aminoglycoside 6-adenylyltransferase